MPPVHVRRLIGTAVARDPDRSAIVLTFAIVFLFFALFAGVFGFLAVGPAGLLLAAVFLGLFVWSTMRHRRGGRQERPPTT